MASDEDYIIEIDKIGKGLRNLVGEEVEVTGVVTNTKGEFKHLKVESFDVLESDDDDYDDDDYGYDARDDDRY